MLSIYDYLIEHAPTDTCAGLEWQIVFNGRVVARFASEKAAITTARLLSAVDREAGRNPTVRTSPSANDDESEGQLTG